MSYRRFGIACHIALVSVVGFSTLPGQTLTIHGTVVTPGEVVNDAVVTVQQGLIVSVSVAAAGSDAVDVDGVIFPGLIDLHNHITWNLFPRWTPSRVCQNRYEWQELAEYSAMLSGPHTALERELGCDANRYGEIKELVNGATSTVGSLAGQDCIRGLVRNLDYLSELFTSSKVGAEPFRNHVFPLEISSPCEEQAIRGIGHAVGSCAAPLAKVGVGLIWSPRSNLAVYGKTTDIAEAKAAGIRLAIAPDWSKSGSSGMLDELSFVQRLRSGSLSNVFTDKEVVQMVTSTPAALAGLGDRIGTIAPHFAADLIVMRKRAPTSGASDDAAAYQALLLQRPSDLRLVVIAGKPVYGDPVLMTRLLPGRRLESIIVCGETRLLDAFDGAYQNVKWGDTEKRLRAALANYRLSLAELTDCVIP